MESICRPSSVINQNAATPPAKIKLAIVGCGKVAEQCHIPAVLSASSVELIALVDSDWSRLDYVKRSFGISCLATISHLDIVANVDAALLLLPNHLHSSVACDFMAAGVHVLCEKPLAPTANEARAMCGYSDSHRVVLATGFIKRFEANFVLMKQLLAEQFLGRLDSFEFDYGTARGWSPLSSYNLYRQQAGGGVLMVHGPHLIDRMLSWFGDPTEISYCDDSHGGIEANCIARFTFASGLTGAITLSKTHALQNRFTLMGEKGRIEIADSQWTSVSFFPVGKLHIKHEIRGEPDSVRPSDVELFRLQLDDFAHAIRSGESARASGRDGLRATALIEECYRRRSNLREPLGFASPCNLVVSPDPRQDAKFTLFTQNSSVKLSKNPPIEMRQDSDSKSIGYTRSVPNGCRQESVSQDQRNITQYKVLVTGSTGFVSGRLCEVLHLSGQFEPRPHVHSTGSASYIARYPMDFVVGDLTHRPSVEEAVKGCTHIVHLARGSNEVMISGLENLLRAAVTARVQRFVHISSVAVHGQNPGPEARYETAPLKKPGNDYGDLKLEQELLVTRYGKKHGLPYVILRPPHITGPNSHFVNALIPRIKAGKFPLIDCGNNVCNLVYVDNLIEAILLSLNNDRAIGETFFVTDKELVTWRSCLEDYAALLNTTIPQATERDLVFSAPPSLIDRLQRASRILLSQEFRSTLLEMPVVGGFGKLLYRGYSQIPEWRRNLIRYRFSSPMPPVVADSVPIRYDGSNYLIAAQFRKVVHSCEKAERILGYTSPISYHAGMAIIREWLEFAKMISATSSNHRAIESTETATIKASRFSAAN